MKEGVERHGKKGELQVARLVDLADYQEYSIVS